MSALLDLAERCEKAIGPDRNLDHLIHAECFGFASLIPTDKAQIPYTALIDAAVTTVPNGYRFILDKRPFADVARPGVKAYRADVWNAPVVEYQQAQSWAFTAALALCAAALRARAVAEFRA